MSKRIAYNTEIMKLTENCETQAQSLEKRVNSSENKEENYVSMIEFSELLWNVTFGYNNVIEEAKAKIIEAFAESKLRSKSDFEIIIVEDNLLVVEEKNTRRFLLKVDFSSLPKLVGKRKEDERIFNTVKRYIYELISATKRFSLLTSLLENEISITDKSILKINVASNKEHPTISLMISDIAVIEISYPKDKREILAFSTECEVNGVLNENKESLVTKILIPCDKISEILEFSKNFETKS